MKDLGRMLAVIAALASMTASMAWSFYEWIYVDQGPAYFAADWRRVALVVALGIGGGVMALLIMRLPAMVRQGLLISTFVAGVLLATVGCSYAAWQLFQLRAFAAEAHNQLMLWSLMLIPVSLVAFAWWLFLRS